MSSIRSRLFIFALKNRYLFTGKGKGPSNTDWTTSIPQLRAQTDRGSGLMGKLPAGYHHHPAADRQPGGRMDPPAAVASSGAERVDRAILYFHGGGYVIGSMVGHRPIVSKFVQASGVPALVFDYRLAPEHPFPAALEDALAAYRHLLDAGHRPGQYRLRRQLGRRRAGAGQPWWPCATRACPCPPGRWRFRPGRT